MLEVRACSGAQQLEKMLPRPKFLADDPLDREAAAVIDAVQRGGVPGAEAIRVPEEAIAASRDLVSEEFLTSLSIARVAIRRFHEYQRRTGVVHDAGDGVRLTREVRPVRRVGILCGGSFMTLLMHALPAQVAGVGEIALAAAPNSDGTVDPRLLATARALGIGEMYRMTGAEAVAALALGADPVKRADKIVGPGGALASRAKRLLSPFAGSDGDLGLGELVVVADASASARCIACDLLAQAEHGAGGPLALLTDDRMLAEAVRIEIGRLAENLPDGERLIAVLDECGALLLFPAIERAIDAANILAPARLSLQTAANERLLPGVDAAGAVFLGPWAAETTGDFLAGLNSFLPAGGSARFRSGLGVDDFVRETALVEFAPGRLALTGRHLIRLAGEEALPAHREAIRERLDILHQTVE